MEPLSQIVNEFRGELLLFGKIIKPKVFWAGFSKAHYAIERLITNPLNKKCNIIVPRGLGKTTLVSVIFPLYHAFVAESAADAPKCVVIISKTQAHSINCLTAIKDVLNYSEEFRTLFGYHGENTAKLWRQDIIQLDNGTVFIAKGTGQPIRGLNFNGIRPTLIIGDDLEDENNTKTPEAMDSNYNWLIGGATYALDARPGQSQIVIIGTPIHQKCIVETLMTEAAWRSIRFSYIETDENGVERSLWEEVRSLKSLHEEKADKEHIGKLSIFYRELMCQIIGDEDQLFKPKYMKYWDGEFKREKEGAYIHISHKDGKDYLEPLVIPVSVFMGVDPASSVSASADYSVIFVTAIDADMNRYSLPYYRGRLSPMDLADKIIEWYEIYKPNRTRIESVGYQEMLRDYLRRMTAIPGLGIKENPRSSKSSRLESMQPWFASGKFFIKKGQQDFVDELLLFPRASHDDTLDGCYYSNKEVYPPSHSVSLRAKLNSRIKKAQIDGWMIS